MKFKRYKHARKLISFYKMNYGVREPYQILGKLWLDTAEVRFRHESFAVVDGTFCQAALKGKIYIKEQLPKYIGSSVQICILQPYVYIECLCVSASLVKLESVVLVGMCVCVCVRTRACMRVCSRLCLA